MTTLALRDLSSLEDCRAVVDLQMAVWGRDSETVPASLLAASIHRGGILIGASMDDQLVGFSWSMPGWREGQPTQWSHMTGVLPFARRQRVAEQLKLAQRARAIAQVELIEWTFDPLQAVNAHFNIAALGCTASSYRVNAYGEMPGPLHRGTPTDRLVAEWWIRTPHVERRLARRPTSPHGLAAGLIARDATVLDAPAAIEIRSQDGWLAPGDVLTTPDARRMRIPVPPRFGEMQQQATPIALAWRIATRDAFTACFSRGYRVVDFWIDRERGGGEYLVTRAE
jgi:predicted GNAT superfamily acetyltransferase